ACSTVLRRKAVFLVAQKRTAETEDILLDAAQHDPDSEVRQQAVFWLSQVPTERAVGMLDSILKTSGDQELQEKAIFALSQQHSPKAADILRVYAERSGAPSEVREKAIFWLGQRHSAENAAFLRGLYAKLTEDDLKERVIFSLAQMRDAENLRWMMDIAVNEREPVEQRKTALFWAGQGGLPDRVAAAPDGEVLLSYTTRPGVCGNGRNTISFDCEDGWCGRHRMSFGRNDDDDAGCPCEPGPARVALRKRGGQVTRLR